MEKANERDEEAVTELATRDGGIARDELPPSPDDAGNASAPQYISGWRMHMLTLGIWIALFLSTLETTIVSTSLVAIADSLSGFEVRNWVVTAYFLTYTGFLVIYAKLASHFGSKTMFLLALTLFTAFSIACGSASTMTQLIILRAFQGMGGSGIYSMVLVIAPALVPPTEYGKYIGIISSVFALASVAGPLVGGAISSNTSWRWVFLLNGPPGVVAIVILALFLPSESAKTGSTFLTRLRTKFSRETTRKVDLFGALSLLAASVLLVFALESGGTQYAWNSAAVISTLILSGILWIVFIGWEIHLERTNATQEPVFPMGLLKNRQLASMMFTTFFIGFPFVSILFTLPQLAQAVYGDNPVQASLSVLPLLLLSPAATAASGVLTSTFNVPPSYLIIIGSVIQVIGVGLAIDLPLISDSIPAKQYGFEAIMGVGFGLTLSTVLTLGQQLVSKDNAGVVMGALTQIRVLGGTIALAVCSALLSNNLRQSLAGVITPVQFQNISETLGAINSLQPDQAARVRYAFAVGYNKQFQLLTAFSGAALLASLFLISRHPIRVRDKAKEDERQVSSGDASESALQAPVAESKDAT